MSIPVGGEMTFAATYIAESIELLQALDTQAIEDCVDVLMDIKDIGGRLFILGVGGSAATASHAVNDFRKMCGIEAYSPCDNVAELTARTNDDGWATTFAGWLDCSNICEDDGLFVFSVNGGTDSASPNIVQAIDLALEVGAAVLGIVGRSGGRTAAVADACVVIPSLPIGRFTPHTEGLASEIAHLLVSHPKLAR